MTDRLRRSIGRTFNTLSIHCPTHAWEACCIQEQSSSVLLNATVTDQNQIESLLRMSIEEAYLLYDMTSPDAIVEYPFV